MGEPDAGRLREILFRDRTFVKRAAVVEGKSVESPQVITATGPTVTVEVPITPERV